MSVSIGLLHDKHLFLRSLSGPKVFNYLFLTVSLMLPLQVSAQNPAQPETTQAPSASTPAGQATPTAQVPAPAPNPFSAAIIDGDPGKGDLSEAQLRQLLVGKTFYLRGGYLDNSLHFDDRGRLVDHSPQGSFTLCVIQVDKVHLSKHKVEFQGQRYALHFLDEAQDSTKAVDKVKITPKKKVVKISIDRVQIEKPKKKKEKDKNKPKEPAPATAVAGATPTSSQYASRMLVDALDRIFAQGIDERMIAAMPDFWKLYYQAAAAKTDYRPQDAQILRQSNVDQKAKLISTVEPPSNELAQANGIAGMALYHAVIGTDGKPQEIVAGRPIGFGLDESAVATIRKATFQPAIKEGKPVPVWLDLVVSFRIYSKRTSEADTPEVTEKPAESSLPGPYSLQH
jgi:outer membrane biosynthesis protein TonB